MSVQDYGLAEYVPKYVGSQSLWNFGIPLLNYITSQFNIP